MIPRTAIPKGVRVFTPEETHDFEYYTGVVFGAFAHGLGYQLASGGRYNRLIGQFGYPCPATGFSFDLERVLGALRTAEVLPGVSGPDILLIDSSPDKSAAHRLARLLRERGFAVARDIIKRDLADSLDYARASAIRRAVILGSAEQPPETVLLRDLTTGTRNALPLEASARAVSQGDFAWPT